ETDLVLDPGVELGLVGGVRDGLPTLLKPTQRAGWALGELHHLLCAGDAGVAPADGALDAVELLLDGEVELDAEGVGFLVDEFGGALAASAVVAEEGERDRVEDARLAAAVGAREHPQGRPVEADLLLVLVREEPGQFHALGNHNNPEVPRVPLAA